MNDEIAILLFWTTIGRMDSEQSADDPPVEYQRNFLTEGSRYQTLLAGRLPVWRDMLETLTKMFPSIYEFILDNKMAHRLEVRLEFVDRNHEGGLLLKDAGGWCYVLYAVFERPGEALVFKMWYSDQSDETI